jgi:hypothetical protein
MTNEQLAIALQELTIEVARLSLRVKELEQADQRRYQTDQEVSAHLNGMTYP